MIINEREYAITSSRLATFEQALAEAASTHGDRPILQATVRRGLETQIARFRDELAAFERLRTGQVREWKLASLGSLVEVTAAARTALGLTQAELARRLEMRPQQIQRYEATRYAGASVERLEEVIEALGLTIECTIRLPDIESHEIPVGSENGGPADPPRGTSDGAEPLMHEWSTPRAQPPGRRSSAQRT